MKELMGINAASAAGFADVVAQQAEKRDAFKKVMQQLEQMQESTVEKARRRAEEQKAIQEKRDRERRINELLSLIARLRSKILSAPGSGGAEAELAAAQGELFWLMFSF